VKTALPRRRLQLWNKQKLFAISTRNGTRENSTWMFYLVSYLTAKSAVTTANATGTAWYALSKVSTVYGRMKSLSMSFRVFFWQFNKRRGRFRRVLCLGVTGRIKQARRMADGQRVRPDLVPLAQDEAVNLEVGADARCVPTDDFLEDWDEHA